MHMEQLGNEEQNEVCTARLEQVLRSKTMDELVSLFTHSDRSFA